ncbi:MAG: fibronectin type III domain-containing protein, partial [Candidatus Acidiferrum sp.]
MAAATSTTQIQLSWTASTDNVGVMGYKVERCSGAGCSNFAQIATLAGTTFGDSGLTASTSYSYRVRATDAAGNNSGYSNTATTSTAAAGNISVTISPKRGGVTISQTLLFTATVKNDVGAAGVTWSTTGG